MSDSQYIDRRTAARSYRPSGYVSVFIHILRTGSQGLYYSDVRRIGASTTTLQGEKHAHWLCRRLICCRNMVILDERRQARQFR